MKYAREFITSTVVGGLFIVVPVYLAVLLLLKGMKSVGSLVRPIAALIPDWLPAERLLSLVLVLVLCFLVGVAVRTPAGRVARERMEKVFFERLPGLRPAPQPDAATGRRRRRAGLAAGPGGNRGRARPGFIIESSTTAGSRSSSRRCRRHSPAPCTSSRRERVHILDIPFTQAIRSVSRWGAGSKDLVAAMRSDGHGPEAGTRTP